MLCSHRIYKGEDITIPVLIPEEDFTDFSIFFYTQGDNKVQCLGYDIEEEAIICYFSGNDLDLLPDGVLRYDMEYAVSGETQIKSIATDQYLATPGGYSALTPEDYYESGYTAGSGLSESAWTEGYDSGFTDGYNSFYVGDPYINVSGVSNSSVFPATGGSIECTVDANYPWYVIRATLGNFIKFSPSGVNTGDTCTLTVDGTNYGETRAERIQFTCMGAAKLFKLNQEGLGYYINDVDPVVFYVPFTGSSSETVIITTNITDEEIEIDNHAPDWITILSYHQEGDQAWLRFSVAPNSGESRSGVVMFGIGDVKSQIDIYQDEYNPPYINVSPQTINVTSEGEDGIEVEVESNVLWSVETNVDWVYIDTGEDWISLGIEENTSSEAREGTIRVYNDEYDLSQTITIHQEGNSQQP